MSIWKCPDVELSDVLIYSITFISAPDPMRSAVERRLHEEGRCHEIFKFKEMREEIRNEGKAYKEGGHPVDGFGEKYSDDSGQGFPGGGGLGA